MSINLKKIIKINLALIIVAGLVVIVELWSMRQQWKATEMLDQTIQTEMLEIKAQKLERSIGHVYQNLRLLSLLPSIRNFQGRNVPKEIDAKYETKYLDDNLRDSIQQVYNNLASNIEVSEVYGVLKGFRPDKGEKPFFMFDELILQEKKMTQKVPKRARKTPTFQRSPRKRNINGLQSN